MFIKSYIFSKIIHPRAFRGVQNKSIAFSYKKIYLVWINYLKNFDGLDSDFLFTSYQPVVAIVAHFSTVFLSLLLVLCVCFQRSLFIINRWIDILSYACYDVCICVVLSVINERLRGAFVSRTCGATETRDFFFSTETRAVTPGQRLWSSRFGFLPQCGRSLHSPWNKLQVTYLTSQLVRSWYSGNSPYSTFNLWICSSGRQQKEQ